MPVVHQQKTTRLQEGTAGLGYEPGVQRNQQVKGRPRFAVKAGVVFFITPDADIFQVLLVGADVFQQFMRSQRGADTLDRINVADFREHQRGGDVQVAARIQHPAAAEVLANQAKGPQQVVKAIIFMTVACQISIEGLLPSHSAWLPRGHRYHNS